MEETLLTLKYAAGARRIRGAPTLTRKVRSGPAPGPTAHAWPAWFSKLGGRLQAAKRVALHRGSTVHP
jgi:hypothetical protein